MPKNIPLLLLSCMLLLLQSCVLHDMGKKDFRLSMPDSEWETTVTSGRAHGLDGSDDAMHLPDDLKVGTVCSVRIGKDYNNLYNTADGDRVEIPYPYMLSSKLISIKGDKLLNSEYRHYDATPLTQLEGVTIDSIISLWGDWVYRMPDSVGVGHYYTYPQIMLLQDGRYYRGVRLHVGPDGMVSSVEPQKGVQRNLFGSLPFYEKILSMNIMEWLMSGPWLDVHRTTPSRGIFFSIINSLGIYFLLILALSAIFVPIFVLFDRLAPKLRWYVVAVIGVIIIAVEYIFLISILDYYSAAWWVTILLLIGMSFGPFTYMGLLARKYCPKCKGHKWWEETEISGAELPKMKFKRTWVGGKMAFEPEKQAFMKIKYTKKSTCKKCGYVDTLTYTEEKTHERNICPKCGKETLTGEFQKYEIGPNNILDAKYREYCTSSGCGYGVIWTLHQPIDSASAAAAPTPKSSGPSRADIAVANINFNDSSALRSLGFSGVREDCWYWNLNDGCRCGADRKPCRYEYEQVNCPYFKPTESFKNEVKARVRANNTPIGH